MLRPNRHAKKYQTPSHARAPEQERKAAIQFGGAVVQGSGCAPMKRGDVRNKGIHRIECKCTKNKSFSVTRKMLQKIEDATLGTGEVPVVEIEFITELGKPQMKAYVLTEETMQTLMEAYVLGGNNA